MTESDNHSEFAKELALVIQKERNRIADGLLEHNKVCNYKAVTEEDCDVCHYLSDAAKLIRGGEEWTDRGACNSDNCTDLK